MSNVHAGSAHFQIAAGGPLCVGAKLLMKKKHSSKQTFQWINPTLPLPLEDDTSVALEDEAAAPLPNEQFQFGDLIVQLQENSDRFLLPDNGKKSVTAYDVIAHLSGSAFKSYKKQVKPLNDKLQVLPYSERYRAIFYFRREYKIRRFLKMGMRL